MQLTITRIGVIWRHNPDPIPAQLIQVGKHIQYLYVYSISWTFNSVVGKRQMLSPDLLYTVIGGQMQVAFLIYLAPPVSL
jgi:hypothetical protein